jgi:hypothetical protein
MADIDIAIEALKHDAKAWDTATDDLIDPTSAVGPLSLSGSPDVMLYGADIGVDTTYNESRAAIEDLLGQATDYFRKLSGTLLKVAVVYEQQEAAGASEFRERGNELEGS